VVEQDRRWITLNTYSHMLPALQREAAPKMDAVLSR
jgi:hypothetical protein